MKKILFSILFFLALIFGCANQAKADYMPKIYITGLEASVADNGQINGNVNIWNTEAYYFTDLNYAVKLYKGVEFAKLELVDNQILQNNFSVSPNETVKKSFSYEYPKNIIDGDYTFRVQIITAKGAELGWKDQMVTLRGANKFLDTLYDFSKVSVGDIKAMPLAGVNVLPTENATAFLKLQNTGDAITVVPHIKIFKRKYNMSLVKEYQDYLITFSKDETKDISLALPKFDAPESYLAEVKFFQGNEQVSGIQYFRWVVIGEGGKVLYIKTDKDSYVAGEEMKIIIDSIGPADAATIKAGKLEVTVYGQGKSVIYKTAKDIDLDYNLLSSTIVVPIKKELVSPTIEATISKDGRVLDSYSITLPVSSTQAQQIKKTQTRNNGIILVSVLLLLLILVGGFIVFRLKMRKK